MQPQNQLLIEQCSWIYKICLQQVFIHEISSLPACLCPPKKEVTDGRTNQPTDQRMDTPSYRVVAHD